MLLIDRYVIRRFLSNFFILLMLLFVFAVSIDLLLEFDEYVDVARARVGADAGFLKRALALAAVIINFHAPRVFQFYAYMLGLISVGAMGFTLAQMHRHRELVALLASGVTLFRVGRPVLLAALVLNVAQLANQEFVLPRLAPLLIRTHGDIGQEHVDAFEVRFVRDGRGSLFQAASFEPDSNTLKLLTILERDEDGRTVRRITADEGTWDETIRAWRLVRGRALMPAAEAGGSTTALLVGAPVEAYASDLDPRVLMMRRHRQFATMLSLGQIRDMIQTPGFTHADAMVRFALARFTTLLINMLVLAMCLPFFLLREPASLLRKSVMCAGTAVPAMMGALLSFAVEYPGIPAAVGVFVPVLVLIPVTLFMATLLKT